MPKKITTTISRQNQQTVWFGQVTPKSQNILDFEAFLEGATLNFNVNPIDTNNISTTMVISDEDFAQWSQYNDLISAERDAYNSANGVTVEVSVEDIA